MKSEAKSNQSWQVVYVYYTTLLDVSELIVINNKFVLRAGILPLQ